MGVWGFWNGCGSQSLCGCQSRGCLAETGCWLWLPRNPICQRCLSASAAHSSAPRKHSLIWWSHSLDSLTLKGTFKVKQKCQTRALKESFSQDKSANLFHSHLYLLKLCLPTEYWPRDVQTNKPDAIWPLNTHIKAQRNGKSGYGQIAIQCFMLRPYGQTAIDLSAAFSQVEKIVLNKAACLNL